MKPSRLQPTTPALAGVVLSALLLAGCATPPQLAALRQDWPAALPARVQVSGVPFYAQPGDTLCGPTTLAMVARAAGSPATPASLTPLVYLPGRQGALQTEMLAAARRQGLVAYPLEPRLNALLRELASGAPVLVFVHGGMGDWQAWAPQWADFTARYRCISYSRRFSSPNHNTLSSTDHSVRAEARDLELLLDRWNTVPAFVVGTSYGAYTALQLALAAPGKAWRFPGQGGSRTREASAPSFIT